jgi:hypothetical protein
MGRRRASTAGDGWEREVHPAGSGASLNAHDSAPGMHRLCLSFLLIFAWLAAATAQPPVPKPYAAVAITRPAASDDASFIAFRKRFAAAAKSRLYAELTALTVARGFFWDRDFGNRFDPHKPAVDNLAAAIALEHNNGSGWRRLAEFAADSSVEPLESRLDVVCAPARPGYDGVAYARLLNESYTTALDWAYPRADKTPVRSAARPDSEVIGTLGLAFVQLLGFEGPDSEPDPGRNLWARVALPNGKTGFVSPGSLRALTAERLCYIKDLVAGWRITGYIAGGY